MIEYIDVTKKRLKDTSYTNENGCWVWTGYKCEPKKLYGLTSSALDGKKKKILAHRLSYRLWKGEIPESYFVLQIREEFKCGMSTMDISRKYKISSSSSSYITRKITWKHI
jgi:hypothetical protein